MAVLLNSAMEQDFPGAASAPDMQPATTKVSYIHYFGNIFNYFFCLSSACTVACTIVQQYNYIFCMSITSFIVDYLYYRTVEYTTVQLLQTHASNGHSSLCSV